MIIVEKRSSIKNTLGLILGFRDLKDVSNSSTSYRYILLKSLSQLRFAIYATIFYFSCFILGVLRDGIKTLTLIIRLLYGNEITLSALRGTSIRINEFIICGMKEILFEILCLSSVSSLDTLRMELILLTEKITCFHLFGQ